MLLYSVVISPPDAVIGAVREMKQRLLGSIGWYHSVNALAHVTFAEFKADSDALILWERYVRSFAARQSPVLLTFNRTASSPKGVFFLAPDGRSARLMFDMMQSFHVQAPPC